MTCTGLGLWQVQRRAWKLDLIERVEARIRAEPAAPPAAAAFSADPAAFAYRRVTARGTFRNESETLVQAVTEHGPGFWVLTPLAMDDGRTLLVNRGFVPTDRRDPGTRAAGNLASPVTVTGLLRLPEPGGAFLRSNDPAAGRWYSRDVAAIAEARGLGGTLPYFLDADAMPNPGGLPIGGLTVVAFRNTHLVYALTWFALAGMALGALGYLVRERWRTASPPSSH